MIAIIGMKKFIQDIEVFVVPYFFDKAMNGLFVSGCLTD
jgi:hypothetical protein